MLRRNEQRNPSVTTVDKFIPARYFSRFQCTSQFQVILYQPRLKNQAVHLENSWMIIKKTDYHNNFAAFCSPSTTHVEENLKSEWSTFAVHPAVRTPEVLRWLSYFHAAFQARQVSHSCVATSIVDIRFRLKRDGFGDWNILGAMATE